MKEDAFFFPKGNLYESVQEQAQREGIRNFYIREGLNQSQNRHDFHVRTGYRGYYITSFHE